MPRFFSEEISGEIAWIRGADAAHIARSLRMKAGEPLTLCDGAGRDYQCIIEEVRPEQICLRIESAGLTVSEPALRVTLFQCVPKGDKLERIVKQSVELGVFRIVPVISERCVSRPSGKSAISKGERLSKIALEAAKQSGRGVIPAVDGFHDFDEMLARFGDYEKVLFFYEEGGAPLRRVLEGSLSLRNVAVVIGSEGGFSPEEAGRIVAAGGTPVTLGPRILRTETAPVAALAALMLLTGNLGG